LNPKARALPDAEAEPNMPPPVRDRHLQQALDALPEWQALLEAIAQRRAQTPLQDHRRIRAAARSRPRRADEGKQDVTSNCSNWEKWHPLN